MIRNKPPADALQLDRCDVCGNKDHRRNLVRTQVEFLDLKAENYFDYSSYNVAEWAVDTAADAGTVSYGNRCDNARTTLSAANVISYINGVQTWTGSGTFRRIAATFVFPATYDLTFSAQVGPHEQNTSPEMTVVLGICESDGTAKQPIKTYTISGATRVWLNEEVATLNAYGITTGDFYFYIGVTNVGSWWVDEMQLEANVNSMPLQAGHPENFVRTSGSYILSSAHPEQSLMTQRKVCNTCAELILSKSERFGKTDEPPTDDPVETWAQEI